MSSLGRIFLLSLKVKENCRVENLFGYFRTSVNKKSRLRYENFLAHDITIINYIFINCYIKYQRFKNTVEEKNTAQEEYQI